MVAVHASNDGKKITSFDDLEGETVPGSAGDIWTIALENYLEANPDKNIDLDYRETDFFQLFQKAEAGDLILLTDYGMANGIQSSNDFDVTVDVFRRGRGCGLHRRELYLFPSLQIRRQ